MVKSTLSVSALEVSGFHIPVTDPRLASELVVMCHNAFTHDNVQRIFPPSAAECKNILLVSNSAHTLCCTMKLKPLSEGTIRKTF